MLVLRLALDSFENKRRGRRTKRGATWSCIDWPRPNSIRSEPWIPDERDGNLGPESTKKKHVFVVVFVVLVVVVPTNFAAGRNSFAGTLRKSRKPRGSLLLLLLLSNCLDFFLGGSGSAPDTSAFLG